jgi:hypothetical protein
MYSESLDLLIESVVPAGLLTVSTLFGPAPTVPAHPAARRTELRQNFWIGTHPAPTIAQNRRVSGWSQTWLWLGRGAYRQGQGMGMDETISASAAAFEPTFAPRYDDMVSRRRTR